MSIELVLYFFLLAGENSMRDLAGILYDKRDFEN